MSVLCNSRYYYTVCICVSGVHDQRKFLQQLHPHTQAIVLVVDICSNVDQVFSYKYIHDLLKELAQFGVCPIPNYHLLQ